MVRDPLQKGYQRNFSTYGVSFSNYTGEFNGSLSFLNDDYTFFIQGSDNIQQETILKNSLELLNPYTGQMDAERHTRQFLDQYISLLKNGFFPRIHSKL